LTAGGYRWWRPPNVRTRAFSSARSRFSDEIFGSGFERAQLVIRLCGDDEDGQIAFRYVLATQAAILSSGCVALR
jgi:hypothetical protein